MENKKDYSIIVGGAAGQGSRKAGLVIAKIFNNLGYNVFICEDYQSLIKGGHNFSVIRVSEEKKASVKEKIDFLLALDAGTIDAHEKALQKNGLIVFNSDKVKSGKGVGVASDTITKELGGIPVMSNTALIAGFSKAAGIEWNILEESLRKELGKGIDKNLEIAKKAYEETETVMKIERLKDEPDPLLT
ncbi:MAG: 2-oxoacid:acceptor oxidoreductase family protein, partial [Candidatus Pacebacteria bacterium]|nr:2-oxoacid:acceptor oxidoreductase family protein [Candidatus Paceibacterota bacterium]